MYPNGRSFPQYQTIVASALADVTGDDNYDYVFLTAKKDADLPYYRNITLIVQEGRTNQLNIFPLSENAGYDPKIWFGDFTGNGVNDILVTIQSGGSGAIIYAYIYSNQKGKITKIFDSIQFSEQQSYKVQYENNYKASVTSNNLSQCYLLDLQYKGEEYLREIYNPDGTLKQPIEGWVDPISGLYPINIAQNGKYYLLTNEQIAGRYHADGLGFVENLLNWNGHTFQVVRQTISIYGEDCKKIV